MLFALVDWLGRKLLASIIHLRAAEVIKPRVNTMISDHFHFHFGIYDLTLTAHILKWNRHSEMNKLNGYGVEAEEFVL